jgi:putative GTP pyrophosphokinase
MGAEAVLLTTIRIARMVWSFTPPLFIRLTNEICMEHSLSEKIIKQFDENYIVIKLCSESSTRLIKNILDNNKINYHSVNGRVKDRERLKEKVYRKGDKYKSLSDITDFLGIRIITYFEDDVDEVAKLISKEFIIDPKNSIDKRIIDNDRFGYKSLHYVVSFSEDRLKLTEYSSYHNIQFEIQIRSILQHSWAEIEHDLGYKGEFEIPDVAKRTFYRLSALLEIADIEFVRLKEIISKYEKDVSAQIVKNETEVSINKASLLAYIHQSEEIKSQIEPISKIYKFSGEFEIIKEVNVANLIERLQKQNIKSINELDKALKVNKVTSLKFLQERYDGHLIAKLNAAAPVYNLLALLEKGNTH